MRVQCQVHTDHFRGDHAAEVVLAVEPRPDETVAQFAERVLVTHKTWSKPNAAWVAIRPVMEGE